MEMNYRPSEMLRALQRDLFDEVNQDTGGEG